MKIKTNKLLAILYGIVAFIYAMLQTQLPGKYNFINLALKYSFAVVLIITFLIKLNYIRKFNFKSILIPVLLGGLILYSTFVNKTESMFILIIYFMFILYDCKEDEILKYYSYGMFCAIAITILAWKIGLVSNLESKGRMYIGFLFSTFGANMFLHTCFAYVAYKKNNIKLWQWFILEIINMYIYIKTDTLAVFILMILLFIMYYILKIKKIEKIVLTNKIVKFIISHLGIILAILTIALQITYNNNYEKVTYQNINILMSGRPEYGRQAFNTLDIKLFGQKINWIMTGGDYFYLDSSYLRILFNNGIIFLIVICLAMDTIEKNALKNKDIYLMLGISFVLIHAISDPQLLSFRYNPFFMIIIPMILNRRELKKYEKTDCNNFEENRPI